MMSPETRNRRILSIVAVLVAAGALAFLAMGNIGKNLVYYWSPSELQQAGPEAAGATVRLGGLVVPGSIEHGSDGLDLRFAVTDGKATVPVRASAVPPAMFRGGIGVVVEGRMGTDGAFHTQRLMVKHDNEYRAPDDANPRGMDELVKTLQLEDG